MAYLLKHGLKHGLTVAVLVVLGWFAIRQWRQSDGWRGMGVQREQIQAAEEDLQGLASQVRERRKLNHDLQHDRETIELYIRKTTGKIKPGEIKVVPPDKTVR